MMATPQHRERRYQPDLNMQLAKLTDQISQLTGQIQTLATMQADWNKRVERLENQQWNERETTISRGWQKEQSWLGYIIAAALGFLLNRLPL